MTPKSRSRRATASRCAARLVVGADGRQSLCREAAGIEVSRRGLNQAALTFNIGHSRPHRNISTEFHTPHGPCVFVPLPGDRCSVVWVAAPREAERLMALERRRIVGGRGEAVAFHSRPRHRRAGTACVSARHRAAPAIRQGAHRAGRRSRPCGAADRRAGPEHGTARRRRYRRHRAARRCWRAKIPARRRCWSVTIRPGAAMSPAAPLRSTWPTARCSAISCRCSRCARPACI